MACLFHLPVVFSIFIKRIKMNKGMKTIISIILVAFIAIGIHSCDKVKNPTIVKATAVGSTFDTVTNAGRANFKKVLLEDYTGHKCPNCPAAAIVAKNLHDKYQDTLVVIAVHAGFFTWTNLKYPTSYTTTAGNDWDGPSGFDISNTRGNPNGMVNRKVFPGFLLIHKETFWPSTVPLAKKDPLLVKIDLKSMYDWSARALNVETKLTFLANYTNNVKLNLVLTEDSIIGPQEDNTKTPTHVEDYEFEHMLRADLNGSWGEVAKVAPISALSTATINTTNFAVDDKFNDRHLTLIAFVYDEVTREILQVEKVKIRK